MRRAGLSELSSTNILVVFILIGLVFLAQAISQQIQKVAELLSQAEATGQTVVPSSHASSDQERIREGEGRCTL
jgi:hypothetical protein